MDIYFSKSLYDGKAVKEAILAYAELADFSLKESASSFKVAVKNIDPEFKNIIKEEFCNYVLALMKK